jgi:hypothetical protein
MPSSFATSSLRHTESATAGSYEVLDAAIVSFTVNGNSLKLGKVTLSEGWKETTRDVSSDDIEIDFIKGARPPPSSMSRSIAARSSLNSTRRSPGRCGAEVQVPPPGDLDPILGSS